MSEQMLKCRTLNDFMYVGPLLDFNERAMHGHSMSAQINIASAPIVFESHRYSFKKNKESRIFSSLGPLTAQVT